MKQPHVLCSLIVQHPHCVFRQPRCFAPVPAGGVAGHLGISLRQQLAVTLLAVTEKLWASSGAAAGGDRVFVLGELDDTVQFVAEGQLHALIGTSGDLGMGQLLVGYEVVLLKAVSVATEGLGVQQGSRRHTCIHTDNKKLSTLTYYNKLTLCLHFYCTTIPVYKDRV